MIRLALAVACGMAVLGSGSRALQAQVAPAARTQSVDSCGSTQSDLTRCSGHELQLSRARLNLLLRVLRDSLESSERAGLGLSQQRWEAYARAQCDWEFGLYGGGSMGPMATSLCLAAETEKRIETLKPFLCGVAVDSKCDATAAYDRAAQALLPKRR